MELYGLSLCRGGARAVMWSWALHFCLPLLPSLEGSWGPLHERESFSSILVSWFMWGRTVDPSSRNGPGLTPPVMVWCVWLPRQVYTILHPMLKNQRSAGWDRGAGERKEGRTRRDRGGRHGCRGSPAGPPQAWQKACKRVDIQAWPQWRKRKPPVSWPISKRKKMWYRGI